MSPESDASRQTATEVTDIPEAERVALLLRIVARDNMKDDEARKLARDLGLNV